MADNGHKLTSLTNEQIAELLGKTRTRNAYASPLDEFMSSDEAAISVKDSFPLFAQKNAMTLYQGFRTAAEKAGVLDAIQIKKIEDNVYLFHTERIAAQS